VGFCSLADLVLMAAGLTLGGAAFLGAYGLRALWRALRPSTLHAARSKEPLSLGYGARLLAPLFARPRAWRVLDVLIGATMLLLAVQLFHQVRP